MKENETKHVFKRNSNTKKNKNKKKQNKKQQQQQQSKKRKTKKQTNHNNKKISIIIYSMEYIYNFWNNYEVYLNYLCQIQLKQLLLQNCLPLMVLTIAYVKECY